jgi:hypothetical protein
MVLRAKTQGVWATALLITAGLIIIAIGMFSSRQSRKEPTGS